MSWSLSAKLAALATVVAADPNAPHDGRIEGAAAAMAEHLPGTMTVTVSTSGHLNQDGTGSCSVNVTASLPG